MVGAREHGGALVLGPRLAATRSRDGHKAPRCLCARLRPLAAAGVRAAPERGPQSSACLSQGEAWRESVYPLTKRAALAARNAPGRLSAWARPHLTDTGQAVAWWGLGSHTPGYMYHPPPPFGCGCSCKKKSRCGDAQQLLGTGSTTKPGLQPRVWTCVVPLRHQRTYGGGCCNSLSACLPYHGARNMSTPAGRVLCLLVCCAALAARVARRQRRAVTGCRGDCGRRRARGFLPAARRRRNAGGATLPSAAFAAPSPRRGAPGRHLEAGGAPPKGRAQARTSQSTPRGPGAVKAGRLRPLALALTDAVPPWYGAGGWLQPPRGAAKSQGRARRLGAGRRAVPRKAGAHGGPRRVGPPLA